MKIEDLMSVPFDFEELHDNDFCGEHKNSRGTIIQTWKDGNGQVIQRRKFDRQGSGWGFHKKPSQNMIWFFFIEHHIALHEENIIICRFSERSEGQYCHGA